MSQTPLTQKCKVTFKNSGRLGNWLFQFSTAYAYSLDHGLEFTVPLESVNPTKDVLYFTHLGVPLDDTQPCLIIDEPQFHYCPISYSPKFANSNIVITGYRQSEKYFAHHKTQILNALDMSVNDTNNLVSVHVRRGDYVHNTHGFALATVEYYRTAMSMFKDRQFKFYSDDIPWCKRNFGHRSDCTFSTIQDPIEDMKDASRCHSHIGGSSTYAWWIGWIGDNSDKVVITPRDWFNPRSVFGLRYDTKDIIPDSWIKIT